MYTYFVKPSDSKKILTFLNFFFVKSMLQLLHCWPLQGAKDWPLSIFAWLLSDYWLLQPVECDDDRYQSPILMIIGFPGWFQQAHDDHHFYDAHHIWRSLLWFFYNWRGQKHRMISTDGDHNEWWSARKMISTNGDHHILYIWSLPPTIEEVNNT